MQAIPGGDVATVLIVGGLGLVALAASASAVATAVVEPPYGPIHPAIRYTGYLLFASAFGLAAGGAFVLDVFQPSVASFYVGSVLVPLAVVTAERTLDPAWTWRDAVAAGALAWGPPYLVIGGTFFAFQATVIDLHVAVLAGVAIVGSLLASRWLASASGPAEQS